MSHHIINGKKVWHIGGLYWMEDDELAVVTGLSTYRRIRLSGVQQLGSSIILEGYLPFDNSQKSIFFQDVSEFRKRVSHIMESSADPNRFASWTAPAPLVPPAISKAVYDYATEQITKSLAVAPRSLGKTCASCDGAGKYVGFTTVEDPCRTCGGSGYA